MPARSQSSRMVMLWMGLLRSKSVNARRISILVTRVR